MFEERNEEIAEIIKDGCKFRKEEAQEPNGRNGRNDAKGHLETAHEVIRAEFQNRGLGRSRFKAELQARSRRLPSSLGTVAFSLVKYVSGMAERGQMRATTRRKVMDTVEKPVAMMGRHGLNHTITRSRNRQWSKFAPSAAVLDHHVMFLASAHKETSLRSSSTTERARLPHYNEAICGFRSPVLARRIDSTSRVLRQKTA